MTGAPGRTPTLSGNSGGWGRASGLLLFGETLLPSELHRKKSETPAGVEPASRSGCSRPPEPSGPTSLSNKGRRWDSNPLRPRYEGGARYVEHRRPIRAASAGVEPTRPEFRAPVPSRGPGQKRMQSQRRDSNPHAPLYKRGARPVELHWRCLAGVDSRRRSGAATVTGSCAATTPYPPSVGLAASIPVRSRTSPSTFARSRAAGTLRGQRSVPRPGVEPGPAPSEGAMMSLSPPGQQQWTVEGVEPSSAGCRPTVFPLDDTPRI